MVLDHRRLETSTRQVPLHSTWITQVCQDIGMTTTESLSGAGGRRRVYFAKQTTHDKHTQQLTMAGCQKTAFAHQSWPPIATDTAKQKKISKNKKQMVLADNRDNRNSGRLQLNATP